ncbi:hypothetical protein [Ktedonospora formicarum]|uniref:Uncharacterized protein n=1 Tax=Ktedonospora formicarum TaxID=2778364 RepID=A0A8J3I581_9CHLR|nr:hypothetical protein [Ktedonospora formicarum]GHO49754.1 hypothetical protein KSX_79170 [Ktedonospora formicarum]
MVRIVFQQERIKSFEEQQAKDSQVLHHLGRLRLPMMQQAHVHEQTCDALVDMVLRPASCHQRDRQ